MKIDLDGIALDNTEEQATGDVQEGRCVSNINTSDQRNVASIDVPGGQGSSHNDLGRSAVVVTFDGSIFGENARTLIESIRSKFKVGDPVPFVSDLSGSADITKVIIDSFVVNDAAGGKGRYDYSIVLKEYKEPPEEPRAPGSGGEGSTGEEEEGEETPADGEAKEWSDGVAGNSEGSINNITGKVLDVDGNPKKGVTVKISGDDGEHSVETDDEGVYRLEDVPPGTYTASVDDDEYRGITETITIGGSGGDTGGDTDTGGDADTGRDTGDADTGGDSEGEDTDTGTDEDTGSEDTDSGADSSGDTDTGDESDTSADGDDGGDSGTDEPADGSDDNADDTGDDSGEDSGEAGDDTGQDTNTGDDADTSPDTGSDTAGDEDTDTGDDTDSEDGDTDEDADSEDDDPKKKTSWGP